MTHRDGVHVFPKQVTEVSYSLSVGKKDDFLQGQDMFIIHFLPPDVIIMAYHIPLFTSVYWSLGQGLYVCCYILFIFLILVALQNTVLHPGFLFFLFIVPVGSD